MVVEWVGQYELLARERLGRFDEGWESTCQSFACIPLVHYEGLECLRGL